MCAMNTVQHLESTTATTKTGNSTTKPALERQKGTAGSAHVTSIPGGISRIREDLLMSTTEVTFDFSATPIIAATIYIVPIATVTNEHISAVICVDPPNSATRDAWLTGADALTSDSQRIPVMMFTPPLELVFTSSVSYIGAKIDVGTTAECRMIVVGVEA